MGTWARLTAVAAVAGTGLAVVSGAAGWGTAHRVLAALALPPLAALVVMAWVSRAAAAAAGARRARAVRARRAADRARRAPRVASLAFAATRARAARTFRRPGGGPARDYVTLTKPRIMSLLLLTGGGRAVRRRGGVPRGRFAADDGRARARLRRRLGAEPLPRPRHRPADGRRARRRGRSPRAASRRRALEFGLALSAFSFVLLDALVNLPTALLALAGNLFYVFVYTRWLKRSTAQNIVIGGAAGAVPPLVGYAGAAGHLGWAALVMFAIVFVWTPPHFWALALMIKEHYARAGVPMLPVVARRPRDGAADRAGTPCVLVAVTLVPVALRHLRARVRRRGRSCSARCSRGRGRAAPDDRARAAAVRLFHYSLLYLALLFVAMAIDTVV